MKRLILAGMVLFITGVFLALLQMWFAPWSHELFLKFEITLLAVFVVLFAIWFTRKEYKDYKRQLIGDRLDD